MSPLQFQKHIRLQEARRLMIANDLKRRSCNSRLWRVIDEDRVTEKCEAQRGVFLDAAKPFVAASETSPMVSAHRLANSLDFTLPHACSMGLRSGA